MKWGKYCFIRSLRDSSEKELESAQQCLALGWHAGSLAALIIIVGNRPQISYEHDIVNGTLCHWAPISSLPRAASKPQDGRIGISLPRFSCLACDQTLGKKVWVPYKLDHLYVMSFGWQGWRPRVVVLKTATLTSVVMSFPPAPSSLLWFLSLRSCSRPSRLS